MSMQRAITVISALITLVSVSGEAKAFTYNTKRGNLVECVRDTQQLTPDGFYVKACRQEVTKPFAPTNVGGNLVICRKGSFTHFNDLGDLESCVIDNTFTVSPPSGSLVVCKPGQRATFDAKGWLVSCVYE